MDLFTLAGEVIRPNPPDVKKACEATTHTMRKVKMWFLPGGARWCMPSRPDVPIRDIGFPMICRSSARIRKLNVRMAHNRGYLSLNIKYNNLTTVMSLWRRLM